MAMETQIGKTSIPVKAKVLSEAIKSPFIHLK